MAKIQIVWTRGDHVYGGDTFEVGSVAGVSEPAPDFGNLPGKAEVVVLEGAVHLKVGDTVTAETGDWKAEGERASLSIRQGQRVAAIAAAVGPGQTDLRTAGATLTRGADATAYVQYDLILAAAGLPTEIPNLVGAVGEAFRWEGARLRSSVAGSKGKTLRVRLFRSQPTLTVADNGVFNAANAETLAVADIAGYVGYIDITLSAAGVLGSAGQANLLGARTFTPAGGTSAWFVLEVRDQAGYPGNVSEIFTLTLEGQ